VFRASLRTCEPLNASTTKTPRLQGPNRSASGGQVRCVPVSVVRIQRASYRSGAAVFMSAARSSVDAGAWSPDTPDAPDGFEPYALRYAWSTSAAVPAVAGAAIEVPVAVA